MRAASATLRHTLRLRREWRHGHADVAHRTMVPTCPTAAASQSASSGGPTPMFSAARWLIPRRCTCRSSSKYSDLFADGGGFDIPANAHHRTHLQAGRAASRASFDVQRIWYSDVASVGNPIGNLFACPTAGAGGTDLQSCLGGSHGAGFGWRNMTVYKLGLRWQLDHDWTGRVGVSHGTQPIPGSQVTFNILAPGCGGESFRGRILASQRRSRRIQLRVHLREQQEHQWHEHLRSDADDRHCRCISISWSSATPGRTK